MARSVTWDDSKTNGVCGNATLVISPDTNDAGEKGLKLVCKVPPNTETTYYYVNTNEKRNALQDAEKFVNANSDKIKSKNSTEDSEE